ncbi:MAG TPA: trehalose-6-phosphate synthase [Anaerolineaceae bacterium]|nr:trehalose-6-phosphate synthase [Anaerolineaceae bacterium]
MPPDLYKPSSHCAEVLATALADRSVIIVSNRGPFLLTEDDFGEVQFNRGGGGLVTALLGMAQNVETTWISCAQTETDRHWSEGNCQLDEPDEKISLAFIDPQPDAYEGYYNAIANPLLWFLQHSIWDFVRSPNITRSTWQAWENGYLVVNRLFAESIARIISNSAKPNLVMFQDYHLYLAPRILRRMMRPGKKNLLTHFIHIPWPGPEHWRVLPPLMRQTILEGLCAVDLLGLQTREDALNFIRTCESLLPGVKVNYHQGRIWYRNHATHVRDFPISINIQALEELANSAEVSEYRSQLETQLADRRLILRIDRTEPSKNIVRGFEAFEELLDQHPEHREKVVFWGLLVPSRLAVDEYQNYLDEIMAAVGRINARYGNSAWEPVRVLVGDDYPRAVAGLKLYDVLLVNSIADGMNLVAKEGPVVNQKDGVLILSERAGAVQQLGEGALVISPCDIMNTSEALHRALLMTVEERHERASRLRQSIADEDINQWLCWQLEALAELEKGKAVPER